MIKQYYDDTVSYVLSTIESPRCVFDDGIHSRKLGFHINATVAKSGRLFDGDEGADLNQSDFFLDNLRSEVSRE